MRVIVLVKATTSTEAGVMPTEKVLTEMGKYNEDTQPLYGRTGFAALPIEFERVASLTRSAREAPCRPAGPGPRVPRVHRRLE